MKKTFFLLFLILCLLNITVEAQQDKSSFVTVEKGQFKVDGKPYYYIGTNFWFGAILGSEGRGGNRERLLKELDLMKEHGIDNLRVLVGAEGPDNLKFRTTPVLQTKPGIYNDTVLTGLDFLLAEMGKRKMKAILFLNNSWDWSGGLVQYLKWNGYPDPPILGEENGWVKYQAYTTQFYTCEPCKKQFRDHIRFIIGRTNRLTNRDYMDDPAIMAWEIANEPRVFSEKNKLIFETWIKETSSLIKSLDKNHLLTTGSEGEMGSENDMELFKRIHVSSEIDYLTIHIWPKNWSWIKADSIAQTLESAIVKTDDYIANHADIARQLNKPLVIEEFGLPRDGHKFSLDAPTTNRDRYYTNIFEKLLSSASKNGIIAGANFWAYGGLARPDKTSVYWKPGDDYMGDPGQEEQGLNSVFDTDTTMGIIKKYNQKIRSATSK